MGGFFEELFSGNSISNLIQGALGATAALSAPEQELPYGSTQAGFDAQMAFEREKLAQAMEIARMNAASAGAGSGAALAAARLGAKVNLAALREKAAADRLAAMLGAQQLSQSTLSNANAQRVQAAQSLGQSGLQGYGQMANLLASYRR